MYGEFFNFSWKKFLVAVSLFVTGSMENFVSLSNGNFTFFDYMYSSLLKLCPFNFHHFCYYYAYLSHPLEQ